jgi:hypothetical protein
MTSSRDRQGAVFRQRDFRPEPNQFYFACFVLLTVGGLGNTTDKRLDFGVGPAWQFIRGIAYPSVGIILIWLRRKAALSNAEPTANVSFSAAEV